MDDEAPDKYCVTVQDGSCVSTDPRCMHHAGGTHILESDMAIRNPVQIDDEGDPIECPRESCDAGADDMCVSNIDGYECMKCNAWFDIDEDGDLIWGYDHLPRLLG